MKHFTFSLFVALLLGTLSVQAQYCDFTSTGTTHYISSFTTTGGTQNITNTGTGTSVGGQGDYTAMAVETYPLGSFTFNAQYASTFGYNVRVWVDWNDDQVFDVSEAFYISDINTLDLGSSTGSISVPAGQPGGSYRMRIVADISNRYDPIDACYTGDGEAEDYTVTVTSSSCPPVSAFTTTNLTSTTIDFEWTAGSSETEWEVIYGVTGFDPNSGGTTESVNTLSELSLTGLTENTEYDIYVVGICGVGDESLQFGPNTIRTLCGSTVVPYNINFESVSVPIGGSSSDVPECTAKENAGTGNDWMTAFQGSNGFSSNVLKYTYHTSSFGNAWFYTQGIELTAGTNYKISYKYGNSHTMYNEALNVAYGSAASYGDMTTQIAAHTGITGGQPTTNEVDFTVATTDVYYFGFQAASIYNQHSLYLDDISIYEGPSCLPPSALSVSNIGLTDADINWTVGDIETEWDVIYGERGFNPLTEGTTVNVSATPDTTLIGLTASTEYEYYVVAVCGANDNSSRVGPIVFATECLATTVPYLIDFENAVIPALPFCTTKENPGGGNEWETEYHFNHGFTGNVLTVFNYNSTSLDSAWFYTQGLELEAGIEYEISYTYGNMPMFPQKMDVAYGASPSASDMTNALASYPNVNSGGATDTAQVFTVAADGTYYFGFNALSDANQNQILLDNIKIVEKAICEAVTGVVVSDIQNLQATISWNETPLATAGYLVEVYVAGEDPVTATPVATETVAAGVTTATITGLTAGTSYDAYVVADCDQAGTTRSDLVNFVTGTVGLEYNFLTQVTYSPNPVSSVLNINAESTIETVVVYNLTGEAVLEVNGNNTSLSVNMSSLSNGTYFVKAKVGDSVSTFKIVKQ